MTEQLTEHLPTVDAPEKLLRTAKSKGAWRKELSQLCRGEGCSATSFDRASEIVAEADSFSTAAALFRLTDGSGAAEPEELAELDRVVESAEGRGRFLADRGRRAPFAQQSSMVP